MKELSIENINSMKTIIVHAGIFHADDVYSVALLNLTKKIWFYNPEIKIIRCPREDVEKLKESNFENENDVIVCDIGGGVYDHHDQKRCRYENETDPRKKGIYASFGLIWKEVGKYFFDNQIFIQRIDSEIIQDMDTQDNLGPDGNSNAYCSQISMFNTDNPTNGAAQMDAFKDAVEFAEGILYRIIKFYKKLEREYTLIKNENFDTNVKIINSDRYINTSLLWDYENLRFVIMPYTQPNTWQIKAIDTRIAKIPQLNEFPNEIKNHCKFVHKSGFMATFDTEEAAEEAAKFALKESL